MSLIPRNFTPVVTGTAVPSGEIQVSSATVNGLNGLLRGTLIPLEAPLSPTAAPGFLNASGVNGTAARDASKNERVYLKSVNTVRYLSQRSRENEP